MSFVVFSLMPFHRYRAFGESRQRLHVGQVLSQRSPFLYKCVEDLVVYTDHSEVSLVCQGDLSHCAQALQLLASSMGIRNAVDPQLKKLLEAHCSMLFLIIVMFVSDSGNTDADFNSWTLMMVCRCVCP